MQTPFPVFTLQRCIIEDALGTTGRGVAPICQAMFQEQDLSKNDTTCYFAAL